MRHLKHILIIALLFSCTKQRPVNTPHNEPIVVLDKIAIELVAVGDSYAYSIILSKQGPGRIVYQFVNKNDSVLSSGFLASNTQRETEVIKDEVFAELELEELRPMTFARNEEVLQYKYGSFGNLSLLIDNTYVWIGRIGNKHEATGRIAIQKINSLDRSFLPFISIVRTPSNPEVRGGSSCVINGTIYAFNAIMKTNNRQFTKLTLSKSTDGLGGTSFTEQPLLYGVGTNGGVDETTLPAYNFYGNPVNIPNTQTWYVPWYEIGAPRYRVNYIYTEDNFVTWENRNMYDGVQFKATETEFEYVGNNTIIALARQEDNAPLLQSVSYDLGVTWSAWQTTNLGSSLGRCMASMVYTPEHGLVVVYADRKTGTIKISLNNDINTILTNPTSYTEPKVLFTISSTHDAHNPLGYPSIIRVSYKRYMIAFSEEIDAKTTYLWVGDGSLKNFE